MTIVGGINRIVGGLESEYFDTVITGGNEVVVGENAKWFMRDKFLRLKYMNKAGCGCPLRSAAEKKAARIAENSSIKNMLKVIHLTIPINFSRKVHYDDEKTRILKDYPEGGETLASKAIKVLKNRLGDSINTNVNRLTSEYNLRAPLVWVLSDMVKYLSMKTRKNNPNMRKIKISPEMSEMVEKIWRDGKYFQYHVNNADIPADMLTLMLYLLGVLEKQKPGKGKWAEPVLDNGKKPVLSVAARSSLQKKIGALKNAVIRKKTAGVQEYVFTVLQIENLIIEHVVKLELYYITLAKNMGRIFESLKKFLK
jgi:hypothetical protein